MAGYVIADVEVTDAELFEKYRKLVPATIEAYGGKYIVRGGAVSGCRKATGRRIAQSS